MLFFPNQEIKLYQRQQKEKLRADQSLGDVVAFFTVHFTEYLFGADHPYMAITVPNKRSNRLINKLYRHFTTELTKWINAKYFYQDVFNMIPLN